jgi:hypothetical protein
MRRSHPQTDRFRDRHVPIWAGLAVSGRIQRDTPAYGPLRTADQLRRDLAAARRYNDQ